ncbi:MAG TPA: hypothetical protein VH639_01605 [Bryobacteraceae bacterium]|jgi:hypothetical protein
MKWVIVALLSTAVALSGYALFKANRLERAAKPRVHLIAANRR